MNHFGHAIDGQDHSQDHSQNFHAENLRHHERNDHVVTTQTDSENGGENVPGWALRFFPGEAAVENFAVTLGSAIVALTLSIGHFFVAIFS